MQFPNLLAFLGVIGAVVFLGWYFSADMRIKRALRQVPATPIGRVRPGERVRVTGTIVEEGLRLRAPFSDRPCAWYRVKVEEYRKSGKSGHWRTLVEEEKHTDFLLGDPTGMAYVRMVAPRVAGLQDVRSRSGTFDDATHVEAGFLSRHGMNSTGLFGFNRTLRYSEAVFELGEDVTVLGRVASDDGRSPTFSGKGLSAGAVVLEPDAELGLLLTDDAATVG